MRWACNGLRNRCSETAITCANGLVQAVDFDLTHFCVKRLHEAPAEFRTCIVYAVRYNLHATEAQMHDPLGMDL